MNEFFIHIKQGVASRKKIEQYEKGLPDGVYRYIIEKTNKRSTPQNRYYFGIVVPMIRAGFIDLGHELTKDETHEFLKARFNSKQVVNEDTGEAIEIPQSTTRLSKTDFMEYIEKIQRFAATYLNMVIPDPNEQLTINV